MRKLPPPAQGSFRIYQTTTFTTRTKIMAGKGTQLGNRGELLAMQWYRERGFVVREVNWRSGSYEIDLIVERWGAIHIVEVKTRQNHSWTVPTDAITQGKLQSMTRAVRDYLSKNDMEYDIQFDLAAVSVDREGTLKIDVYENILEFKW